MPYYFVHWTDTLIDYIGQHGVTPEEFEEVVMDPDDVDQSHSSDREVAFGWTASGKYLCCVYELSEDGSELYPVTAYEVET